MRNHEVTAVQPLLKADGSLTDEKDLPEDFIPMLLAIHIGKKLD